MRREAEVLCNDRRSWFDELFKMAAQRGRSKRGSEAYPLGYVEDLSDARTMLEGIFNSLSKFIAEELRFEYKCALDDDRLSFA